VSPAGDLLQLLHRGQNFRCEGFLFLRNRCDPRSSLEAKLLAILTFTKYSLRVGDISRPNAANEVRLALRE
jgi:hypothetical protein